MHEYIDRESIYKTLSMENPFGWNNDDLAELFREAKPADVALVRHGRWLGTHDGWYYSYSCSECGAEALTKEETMHDQVCSAYCPNCGCRMDGGEQDA